MPPEAIILIVNVVFLAFGYGWAYPALPEKTLRAVLARDVIVSITALVVSGGLFFGTGTRFSLIVFETNWLVFAVLTLSITEVPLFAHFAKKYDLKIYDDE